MYEPENEPRSIMGFMNSARMNSPGQLWYGLGLVLLVAHTVHGIVVATLPTITMVQYVPDDTYYYLSLVRHFVEDGSWTFDGGISKTSGFQILYAYLLVPACLFSEATGLSFPRAAVGTSTVLSLTCFSLLLLKTRKHGWPFLASSLIVLCSINVFRNVVSGMEWAVVLLMSVLFWSQFAEVKDSEKMRTPCYAFGIAAICCGGVMARLDFALLPLCYLTTSVVVNRLLVSRFDTRIMVAVTLGTVAGIVIVCGHSYMITGDWLQDSAQVKTYWGSIQSYDVRKIVLVLGTLALPEEALVAMAIRPAGWIPCLLLILVAAATTSWFVLGGYRVLHRQAKANPQSAVLIISAMTTVTAYIVAYGAASHAVQFWYTAHCVVPVIIICGVTIKGIHAAFRGCAQPLMLAAVAVVISATGGRLLLGHPFMPWQSQMYLAGLALKGSPCEFRAGSWNAGIINYYQGGTVVNLDGLVNHDILSYVRQGRLMQYLREKGIDCVADFVCAIYDPRYGIPKESRDDGRPLKTRTLVKFPTGVEQFQCMRILQVTTGGSDDGEGCGPVFHLRHLKPHESLGQNLIPLDAGFVLEPAQSSATEIDAQSSNNFKL